MTKKLNDTEREQWVLNDEGLYNWYQSECCTMLTFIRVHRAELDELILAALAKLPRK